jgi:hypothetical protein
MSLSCAIRRAGIVAGLAVLAVGGTVAGPREVIHPV